MAHIFGPVLSRRLGRSLGIDLLPFKTCSFNCIYCECGPTINHSITRKEFFPVEDIIDELDEVLSGRPELDYVTFAGSGEPTLSLSIGRIISHVKENYPDYRIAVLTNGSLLLLPEVRRDLLDADLIIPTLSTTSQRTFECIHRPVPGLSVSGVIEGIGALRKEFSHQIWLEVFLVPLLNTTRKELSRLYNTMYAIQPDRIQINTLDRPGTESWVQAVNPDEIANIAKIFSQDGIPVDIIETANMDLVPSVSDILSTRIGDTLSRRPCTVDDIAQMTGLHLQEVRKKLDSMMKQGKIQAKCGDRGIFYTMVRR